MVADVEQRAGDAARVQQVVLEIPADVKGEKRDLVLVDRQAVMLAKLVGDEDRHVVDERVGRLGARHERVARVGAALGSLPEVVEVQRQAGLEGVVKGLEAVGLLERGHDLAGPLDLVRGEVARHALAQALGLLGVLGVERDGEG